MNHITPPSACYPLSLSSFVSLSQLSPFPNCLRPPHTPPTHIELMVYIGAHTQWCRRLHGTTLSPGCVERTVVWGCLGYTLPPGMWTTLTPCAPFVPGANHPAAAIAQDLAVVQQGIQDAVGVGIHTLTGDPPYLPCVTSVTLPVVPRVLSIRTFCQSCLSLTPLQLRCRRCYACR